MSLSSLGTTKLTVGNWEKSCGNAVMSAATACDSAKDSQGFVLARRAALRILDEAFADGAQRARERRDGEGISAVVRHALGRAREEREIVRLARMAHRKRPVEHGAACGELVQK